MTDRIEAKNLSAQLQYRAAGNPPSTLPDTAISNAYPGLEMDFRNIWKRILTGIELHESSNFVVAADPGVPPEVAELAGKYRLIRVAGAEVMAAVKGPRYPGGPVVSLPDTTFDDPKMPLEWSNALAEVVHRFTGQAVDCTFESIEPPTTTRTVSLIVRRFFEEGEIDGERVRHAVIARDIAEAGALTQSLCSPWQNDYRECACFYWAATRPDYVNVEPRPDGTSSGNNWMQRGRTASTPRVYIVDDWMDARLLDYSDLFRDWERALRFVIDGRDEEPPPEG